MIEHAEKAEKVRPRPAEVKDGAKAPEPDAAPEKAVPLAGLAVPGHDDGVRRRGSAPADPLGGSQAAPEVASALQRRRGKGSRLDGGVEASFGQAMQADLSQVRVHTDGEADTIARSVQATAFTQGNDVYFTRGSYAPSTSAGQHLLAHELSHVVQQQSGADTASGTTIGRADDPLEAAADRTADQVLGAMRRRAARPAQD